MCRDAPLATATTQAHHTTPPTQACSQLSALLFTDGRTPVPVTDDLDPGVNPGERGTLRFCVKADVGSRENRRSVCWPGRNSVLVPGPSDGGGLSAYVCFAARTQAGIWLTGSARQVEANKRAARRGRRRMSPVRPRSTRGRGAAAAADGR